MSAEVYRNPWGYVVGHCRDCKETISGAPSTVELWADVHNSDNHRPDPTQDPEGRALVQAIHDRKARADDAPV